MSKLGNAFYERLLEISNNVGMNPEDILNIMTVESGLIPSAGKHGGAGGLVQFMPETLKGLGFKGEADDFKNVPAFQQLDYVEKWMKSIIAMNGGKNPKSVTQYYVGNFLPVALKLPGVQAEDPNTIIVAKNPTEPHLPNVSIKMEKLFYNSNPSLDYDKDGAITYGDLQNVLNNATKTNAFQTALAEMRSSTGYSGQQKQESLVAKVPQKENSYVAQTQSKKESGPSLLDSIENMLGGFLKMVSASDNKKIYKKILPNNDILIKINSDNYTNSLEFSRILCSAIDSELLADAEIHTDGKNIEVQCSINGQDDICLKATEQLTNSLSDAFKIATNKIGGININAELFINKRSFYRPIDLKIAETNYRTFLLKFF